MYAVDYKLTTTLLVYMVTQMQVHQTARTTLSWEMERVISENKWRVLTVSQALAYEKSLGHVNTPDDRTRP
jgi:hypothetical protein